MRMRDFIDDLGLKEGEHHRGDCPQCRGKNTFTATNTLGDIQYNCFKLGCTIRGIYVTDMTAAEIRRRLEDQQTQRAYTNITHTSPPAFSLGIAFLLLPWNFSVVRYSRGSCARSSYC